MILFNHVDDFDTIPKFQVFAKHYWIYANGKNQDKFFFGNSSHSCGAGDKQLQTLESGQSYLGLQDLEQSDLALGAEQIWTPGLRAKWFQDLEQNNSVLQDPGQSTSVLQDPGQSNTRLQDPE